MHIPQTLAPHYSQEPERARPPTPRAGAAAANPGGAPPHLRQEPTIHIFSPENGFFQPAWHGQWEGVAAGRRHRASSASPQGPVEITQPQGFCTCCSLRLNTLPGTGRPFQLNQSPLSCCPGPHPPVRMGLPLLTVSPCCPELGRGAPSDWSTAASQDAHTVHTQ